MKKYHKHLIKTFGINKFIAIKAQIKHNTDNMSSLYGRIKANKHYQISPENMAYDLSFHFSQVKDFAQYVIADY